MQRLRVRLKGFDCIKLDQALREIIKKVSNTGARISGPIPLPTRDNNYTIFRPPDSRKPKDYFVIKTHLRLLDIIEPTPLTINQLMKVDMPSGVDIKIIDKKFI
jgi:small subunit ribosomal protein S10